MRRRQMLARAAVVATVLSILLWLAWWPGLGSTGRLLVIAGALGAHASVLALGRKPGTLERGLVVGAVALVLGAAVLAPPRDSNDLWGYVSYARVASAHHANPYLEAPDAFPEDPLLERMSAEYRSTPTIYGPVFTAVSVAGTLAAAESPLVNRLFFQLLAAGAAVAGLVLVWRHTGGSVAALAFLGLSPVVAAVVNGAHPDLLVGVLVLGGATVVARGRPLAGALLLAAASLVKVLALAPAAAVVVWAWRRWGVGVAAQVAATLAGVVTGAYLLVGGRPALNPLLEARAKGSRGQAWEILRDRWTEAMAADGVTGAAAIAHGDVARLATPLTVALVLLALWRLTRPPRGVAVPVVGAGLGYLLASPFVLPWYPAMVLPAAATVWRTPVAILAHAQAALLLLVYADPPGHLPPEGILADLSTRWLPLVGVVLAAALVVVCWLRPTPEETGDAPPLRVPDGGPRSQPASLSR